MVESHRAGLYTVGQMTQAFEECGMHVEHDGIGPSGRRLYIGRVAGAA